MFRGNKLPLMLAFGVLVLVAFGTSCKGFFVKPVLTTITVGPTSQNIEQGKTLQMSARGTFDDGSTKNITSTATWSSDTQSVATVSTGGLVTGVTPGNATISASQDALSNSADVTVVIAGVTAITISPKNPNVKIGTSVDFTCTATVSGQANPIDVTASVTWTTSDTTNTDITNQENPAVFTVKNGAPTGPVTVKATYTVGTTTFTDTTTATVIN